MTQLATTDILLHEAARWRLIGLLFERPREGWHAEVRSLAVEVDDATLRDAAESIGDFGEGAYLAVLGPGGFASPREVGYRPMGDPGKILAGLRTVYDAFLYRPRAEDPPDHIAVIAGFIGYMKMKEAYADARDDAEAVATTRAAIESVVEDHLEGFTEPLAERLQAGPRHLKLAGSALLAVARRSLPTT